MKSLYRQLCDVDPFSQRQRYYVNMIEKKGIPAADWKSVDVVLDYSPTVQRAIQQIETASAEQFSYSPMVYYPCLFRDCIAR